ILTAFEFAEQSDDRDETCKWLTFVIIGAGPTGVEMAGAIREIAAEVMRRDFDQIDPADTRVVLIDALPHILAGYPDELSEEAKEELESRDIEVWVDSPVDDIGRDYVSVGERTVSAQTIVWAAGVEPSSLLASLDTEVDEAGYVVVDRDLTLVDSESEFVVGDASHFEHDDLDEPLPALAPVAIQQGKHVAKNIRRRLRQEAYEPFEYRDRGQMSTIGRAAAVAEIGPYHGVGFFAWLLWLFVHLFFLIGFKNRITVLIEWIYSYLVFKRGARIIIGDSGTTPAEETIEADIGRRAASGSAAQ
ncbi:MAG: NAD(P)/FAD-dependent oxidoreductase, partial [Persicimonas sp.]